MILRPFQWRREALQAATRCSRSIPKPLPPCQRLLHTAPQLTNEDNMKQEGVPSLFSPEGFDMAWTQYQGLMVKKLNEMTAGTPDANVPVQTLLLQYARDPANAPLFNHASMAYNNHFFFRGLHIYPRPKPIPTALSNHLTASFSSLDSLRAELLAAATSMFGPGFVWVVRRQSRDSVGPTYRILCTYLAGSPLAGAHFRAQSLDMNTQNVGSLGGLPDMRGGQAPAGGPRSYQSQEEFLRLNVPQNAARLGFGAAARDRLAPGGVDVVPILCVNTWEHVWLYDWGIGGKRKYLEAWWDRIDWDAVSDLAGADDARGLGGVNRFLRR